MPQSFSAIGWPCSRSNVTFVNGADPSGILALDAVTDRHSIAANRDAKRPFIVTRMICARSSKSVSDLSLKLAPSRWQSWQARRKTCRAKSRWGAREQPSQLQWLIGSPSMFACRFVSCTSRFIFWTGKNRPEESRSKHFVVGHDHAVQPCPPQSPDIITFTCLSVLSTPQSQCILN